MVIKISKMRIKFELLKKVVRCYKIILTGNCIKQDPNSSKIPARLPTLLKEGRLSTGGSLSLL